MSVSFINIKILLSFRVFINVLWITALNLPGLYAIEKLRFNHVNIESGLSNSNISCIIQDSTGFIWIGTEDGLNRLSGRRIRTYLFIPSDIHSLRNNQISALCNDNGDNIWVAHKKGIDCYLADQDRFIPIPFLVDDKKMDDIRGISLYKDRSGNIYAGTNLGLFKFCADKSYFEKYNLPGATDINMEEITAITSDKRGVLWIGTLNRGVYSYDPDNRLLNPVKHQEDNQNTLAGNKIFHIYEDNYGILWISSEQGLYAHFTRTHTTIRYLNNPSDVSSLPHRTVWQVSEDSKNRLWILTNGGLSQFNRKDETFYTFRSDDFDPFSLSSNAVRCFYEDSQENIWIGTLENGVNIHKYQHLEFSNFTRTPASHKSLNYAYVLSIAEDRNGKLWIGTNGGGINIYHSEGDSFSYILPEPDKPHGIKADAVQALHIDQTGLIWIGTYLGGLTIYDPTKNFYKTYRNDPADPDGISSNIINYIVEDSRQNIWIATNGGLNRFNRTDNKFISYGQKDEAHGLSLTSNFCTVVMEDIYGMIWVGTHYGLNRLDPLNNIITKYLQTEKNGISDNAVFSLHEDSKGRIWIGTAMGLNMYDRYNDSFQIFTTGNGLPNNTINGILEDKRGMLWLSTNNGLSRFDPDTRTCINFGFNDGLITTEFHRGAYFRNNKGRFYFGGKKGMTAFYPDKFKSDENISPVVINEFYINNKPVSSEGKRSPLSGSINKINHIKLAYNQSFITFEFSALNFINPEKDRYAYKLEGFDQEWIEIGNKTTANYTNIPSGNYIFQIRVVHNNNLTSYSKPIQITIKPPFWKNPYAYILYLLVISGITYLVWNHFHSKTLYEHSLQIERLEREKAEELNQSKMRFFINVSHEFKTPLTLIISPIEQMIKTGISLKNKEMVLNSLKNIYKNTMRLSRLINQIMDLRKIETGNITFSAVQMDIIAFIKNLAENFGDYANQHGIELKIISSLEYQDVWVDTDKIEKSLFNILSNAFRYTPDGGLITIEIDTVSYADVPMTNNRQLNTDAFVRIAISDNGKGISPENINKIFTRFYQTNDYSLTNPASTGIGLSITKEFIEMHHGIIKVESALGKGSSFSVYLPLGNSHLKPEEMSRNRPGAIYSPLKVDIDPGIINRKKHLSITPPAKKYRILVAEDNHELRDFILDHLEVHYEVFEASDGMEALKIANSVNPHLIISDIIMPELSGVDLCKKLKTDFTTSHIPILLITELSDLEHQIEGFETGADDYITKPFSMDLLLVKISSILTNRDKVIKRFIREPKLEIKDIAENSMDKEFLQRSIEVVEKSISNTDFSVDDFCNGVGMSRSRLHSKLKALTNQSATEFVRMIRLKRAAVMLEQKRHSISEVAFLVGFNHISYFNRCFRKQFGKTPSDYQKNPVLTDWP